MNDAVLPAKNAPGIVAPEGTADLSAFLDVNSFGIVQWAELVQLFSLYLHSCVIRWYLDQEQQLAQGRPHGEQWTST